MKKNILLTAAALLTTLAGAAQWQPAGDRIGTEWGEKLDPQNVLPEYPRPQMTRTQVQDGWQNLNGLWNYAILPMGETPEKYDGQMKCTPNIGRISICLDGMSSVLYRAHVV